MTALVFGFLLSLCPAVAQKPAGAFGENPIRSSFLPEVPAFSQASANPTLQPLPLHPTAQAQLGNP